MSAPPGAGHPGRTRKRWIDITLPIRDAMLNYPDDPPARVARIHDVAQGDSNTITQMTITSHTGTHIDAPLHFIAGGQTIDRMPLEAGIGPARVVEISDPESIKLGEIDKVGIRKGERVLFRTRNSSVAYQTDDFTPDYVYIAPEAAHYLAHKGVLLVGVDYLSVGAFQDADSSDETHRALLNNGVWVLEGLNLADVRPGRYELVCLPLRLEAGDGAPVRAIVRAARTRQR